MDDQPGRLVLGSEPLSEVGADVSKRRAANLAQAPVIRTARAFSMSMTRMIDERTRG